MRNINLPKARVYVRKDAFSGSSEEFEPAWLVSVRALRSRPLCFQVWVDKYAACYDKVPPHTLYWKVPSSFQQALPLSKIQMWECLSGSIECWVKAQLGDAPVIVNLGKDCGTTRGKYWFTLDFIPENEALGYIDVGEAGVLEEHKEGNVIKLANGQIAIYPNNRLKWLPPSLTSASALSAIPPWSVASDAQWEAWMTVEDKVELHGDSEWAY